MKQMILATAGFERYGKTTRRAVFLAEMERVVPWPALCGLIEPVYPKAGNSVSAPALQTAQKPNAPAKNSPITPY
jgi:hypothetical protein